jgi:hypothetical protein
MKRQVNNDIDYTKTAESFFFQNHPALNEYMEQRLQSETTKQPDAYGCIIATSRKAQGDTSRTGGYCQLKLRHGKKADGTKREACPHHYKIAYFLEHKQVPPSNLVGSHLCERGAQGCIGHNQHVVYEDSNYAKGRQECHWVTRCTNCETNHFFKPCPHEPPCIRADQWLVADDENSSDD